METKLIFRDIELLDTDLLCKAGDFSFVASDEQHIIDIMQSYSGEYKQFPEVGVGVGAFLASSGQEQNISRNVRVQLTADGYQVKSPDFAIDEKGNIKVAPHAIR